MGRCSTNDSQFVANSAGNRPPPQPILSRKLSIPGAEKPKQQGRDSSPRTPTWVCLLSSFRLSLGWAGWLGWDESLESSLPGRPTRPGWAGRQVGRSEFAEIRWEAFAVGRAQARLSPKLAEPTPRSRNQAPIVSILQGSAMAHQNARKQGALLLGCAIEAGCSVTGRTR